MKNSAAWRSLPLKRRFWWRNVIRAMTNPICLAILSPPSQWFQLYLMFDQVAMDASRYEYPVALLSIQFEEIRTIRQKWGPMSGDEAVRAAASLFE